MKVITANRKTLYVKRRVGPWSEGIVRVDHQFTAPSRHSSVLVTGDQWIFAKAQVQQGSVCFVANSNPVVAPSSFTMFLPPRSIIRIEFERCILNSSGFLSRLPILNAIQLKPAIFPPANDDLPATLEEIESLITGARSSNEIGVLANSRSAASRAKQILDYECNATDDISSIAKLAVDLGISREALSRSFKRTYGLSPVQYKIHVRVMNAVMRLAQGEAILKTAFDVGFGDISRFYKQFTKIAAATPKIYKLLGSQNAKIS